MPGPHDRSLNRHRTAYRSLLVLYPRAFRRRYAGPMAQAFGDRLRDERARHRLAAVGVWLRTLGDLLVSAPAQRIEAAMSRTSPIARALVIAVFVATLVAVSVALGSMAPFAVPLLAALPLVIVWQWRRLRELTDSESLPWWRLLLVGIAVLAFVIVTFGGPWPESVRSALTPPFAYFIVIGLVMASFVLMGLGVLLGLVTAWRHSRSAPA